MLFKLHRIKCNKSAKVTAKLVISRVAVPLVLEEDGLIGAREITLRAVVGKVRTIMSLHVLLILKDGTAGVMSTFYNLDPMHFGSVSEKLLAQSTLERTTLMEAGHWLAVWKDVVCLHVSLKQPALAKAFTTGGARIAVAVDVFLRLISVHGDKVASDCVPLHGRIFTQVAMMDLFTRLTESVYA